MFTLLVAMAVGMQAPAMAPVDPVLVAEGDAQGRLDAANERYVWIGGLDAQQQRLFPQALNSHLNRLSREPEIVHGVPVAPGLLRINFRDFDGPRRHFFADAWDKLRDPFFGTRVLALETRGPIAPPPKVTATQKRNAKAEIIFTFAGGTAVEITLANYVYKITGNRTSFDNNDQAKRTFKVVVKWQDGQISEATFEADPAKDVQVDMVEPAVKPEKKQIALVVDGLWFLNQTATDVDNRVPAYHDFLGFQNEDDFDRLVGFDPLILKDFPKRAREAVSDSGVARQPRRIDVDATVGGPYWRTSDNRLAQKNNNPLQVLDDVFKFDARESIACLPNGMLVFGLFNSQRVRQDSAPDFIAPNKLARNNDHRILNNVSCIQCHATGIQDIPAFYRSVLQPSTLPLVLQSPDPDKLKDQTRLYFSRLESYINQSRQLYADAIMQATTIPPEYATFFVDPVVINGQVVQPGLPGLTPEQDSANYVRFFLAYEEAKVDRAYVARYLGITEAQLVGALKNELAMRGSLSPIFTNFIGPNLPVSIRQMEEFYFDLLVIVKRFLAVPG